MILQPENRDETACAGLYIHVPFCLRKCPYCDFYSITNLYEIEPFVDGLAEEIRLGDPYGLEFDTIYMGGGTPCLLKPSQAAKILESVRGRFFFSNDVEVTIEVNPGTITLDSLKALFGCGINRVNMGVQSFDDQRLRFLGRLHSAHDAREAIHLVRQAGGANLGIDLIYGLPDQSSSDWLKDLREATSYEPEHISCYMLTYEKRTPIHGWRKAGRFHALSEDRVGGLFKETVSFLTKAGYDQYEISNFARGDNLRSKHNQKYWCHAPYVGLGPSAHSFVEPKRWWNPRSLEDYLQALERGVLPLQGSEELNQGQLMLESVFLGLRTSAGIEMSRFKRQYGVDFLDCFGPVCEGLKAQNFMLVSSDRCVLTIEGMMVADTIAGMFADHISV